MVAAGVGPTVVGPGVSGAIVVLVVGALIVVVVGASVVVVEVVTVVDVVVVVVVGFGGPHHWQVNRRSSEHGASFNLYRSTSNLLFVNPCWTHSLSPSGCPG